MKVYVVVHASSKGVSVWPSRENAELLSVDAACAGILRFAIGRDWESQAVLT